ncbi:uncharacterized protein PHALS_10137 [Plasmopara halstedii]|uniref:Uncharacterized protein n=1 Tax=Plasmopara halstedii TaxID=4781 RepID=A0A0P1AFP3_PLAHL|nr:uncharacterized protein PHALS_10137 [Plasmopara halstedii]CEG39910.1 hypothetical protein PHALS_10137 [Plasmopara halstedii]|eukprot:XP_024576279.1 hypothetical protein PHALS_10137 [Plasmopara halstedii]
MALDPFPKYETAINFGESLRAMDRAPSHRVLGTTTCRSGYSCAKRSPQHRPTNHSREALSPVGHPVPNGKVLSTHVPRAIKIKMEASSQSLAPKFRDL